MPRDPDELLAMTTRSGSLPVKYGAPDADGDARQADDYGDPAGNGKRDVTRVHPRSPEQSGAAHSDQQSGADPHSGAWCGLMLVAHGDRSLYGRVSTQLSPAPICATRGMLC